MFLIIHLLHACCIIHLRLAFVELQSGHFYLPETRILIVTTLDLAAVLHLAQGYELLYIWRTLRYNRCAAFIDKVV